MSKKILTLDNVPVINKKIGKIDTIEKLKASTIYSLGDVVEVLGFHAKGDGSHHKRIAKAEDDGSGELGQNGIWWCIVHSGEVNVSWFGAKGDGVTDDTEAIQKAIDYISDFDENGIVLKNEAIIKLSKKYLITDTLKLCSNVNLIGEMSSVGHSSDFYKGQGTSFIFKNMKGKNVIDVYIYDRTSDKKIVPGYLSATGTQNLSLYYISKNIKIKNISIIPFEQDLNTAPNWGIYSIGTTGLHIDNVWIRGTIAGICNCASWNVKIEQSKIQAFWIGYFSTGCTQADILGVSSSGCVTKGSISYSSFDGSFLPDTLQQPQGFVTGTFPFGQESVGFALIGTANYIANCTSENARNAFAWSHTGPGWLPTFFSNYTEFNDYCYTLDIGSIGFKIDISNSIHYDKLIRTSTRGTSGHLTITNSNGRFNDIITANSMSECTSNYIFIGTSDSSFELGFSPNRVNGDTIKTKNANISSIDTDLILAVEKTFDLSQTTRTSYRGARINENGTQVTGFRINAGNFFTVNRDKSWDFGLRGDNKLVYRVGNVNGYSSWVEVATVTLVNTLDTPYYALKMQEQGIYEDYIAYRDELFEYENSQTSDDTMLLPVLHEPIIPESIKQFAEKYKLI